MSERMVCMRYFFMEPGQTETTTVDVLFHGTSERDILEAGKYMRMLCQDDGWEYRACKPISTGHIKKVPKFDREWRYYKGHRLVGWVHAAVALVVRPREGSSKRSSA